MSVRLTVKQSSEAGGKPTEFVLDDAVITLGRDKACQVVLAQQAMDDSWAAAKARQVRLRSGSAPPVTLVNQIEGHVDGLEGWATWQAARDWRLGAGFLEVRKRLESTRGTPDPTQVLTLVTPGSATRRASTRRVTSSLAAMLVPSGNHTSTRISGRLESGKNCCCTCPMPSWRWRQQSRSTAPAQARRWRRSSACWSRCR